MKYLNISNCICLKNFDPNFLTWSTLQTLICDFSAITANALKTIPCSVTTLSLSHQADFNKKFFYSLGKRPALKLLNIASNPGCSISIITKENFPSLVKLSLEFSGYYLESIGTLRGIYLTSLDISDCFLTVNDADLSTLSGMPLEELKLKGMINVTNAGMKYLENITTLKRVMLQRTRVGVHGLKRLLGIGIHADWA